MNFMHMLRRLLIDESGQDLVEYALVAAVIALGAVASMKQLSNTLGSFFNTIGTDLNNSL